VSYLEAIANAAEFRDSQKGEQAEMLTWGLSAGSPALSAGVDVGSIADAFHQLLLPRPKPARLREHFRRSQNIRSLGGGKYLPSREFASSMSSRFGPRASVAAFVSEDALNAIPLPPYVSEERRADLAKMLPIYAQLFLLENSMRGLVENVLAGALGPSWWELAASEGMKRKHQDRLRNEQTKKWAPARADLGPLFSIDWSDLITLMRKYEVHFKPIVGEIAFLHRYDDAAMYRHVVAHNGAFRDEDDSSIVGIHFRAWIKQIAKAA
jgi:hypothetical protein